jgi:uncharacterized protein YkwD
MIEQAFRFWTIFYQTAISFAVDDMMKDKESRANILNPELTHVSTGIAVGNGKVLMVFDFEARRS